MNKHQPIYEQENDEKAEFIRSRQSALEEDNEESPRHPSMETESRQVIVEDSFERAQQIIYSPLAVKLWIGGIEFQGKEALEVIRFISSL